MYKYPYQIQSSFTKSKDGTLTTLGIEEKFTLETGSIDGKEEESVNPLEMHAGFSRLVFTIISTGPKGKSFVTANIPVVDDADEIIARTRAAESIIMSEQLKSQEVQAPTVSTLSKAYTVALTMGQLKGSTPAAILIKSPQLRDKLIEQSNFLSKNVSKFPSNQDQIDAIADAIRLFDAGQLNANIAADTAKTASDKCISIYSAEFKPLRSTLEDGRVMVYNININCYPSHRYPYEIVIKNTFSRWDEKIQTAHPSSDDKKVELSILLSERKMLGIVGKIEREIQSFETCCYTKQLQKATLANDYNRRIAQRIAQ